MAHSHELKSWSRHLIGLLIIKQIFDIFTICSHCLLALMDLGTLNLRNAASYLSETDNCLKLPFLKTNSKNMFFCILIF